MLRLFSSLSHRERYSKLRTMILNLSFVRYHFLIFPSSWFFLFSLLFPFPSSFYPPLFPLFYFLPFLFIPSPLHPCFFFSSFHLIFSWIAFDAFSKGLYLNLFRAHISNPSCAKSNPFTTPFLALRFMHNVFASAMLAYATDRVVSLFANHWIDRKHYHVTQHDCVSEVTKKFWPRSRKQPRNTNRDFQTLMLTNRKLISFQKCSNV
jgi:hypothetical protein